MERTGGLGDDEQRGDAALHHGLLLHIVLQHRQHVRQYGQHVAQTQVYGEREEVSIPSTTTRYHCITVLTEQALARCWHSAWM